MSRLHAVANISAVHSGPPQNLAHCEPWGLGYDPRDRISKQPATRHSLHSPFVAHIVLVWNSAQRFQKLLEINFASILIYFSFAAIELVDALGDHSTQAGPVFDALLCLL
mmetsp:Transcript_124819/g.249257  ORF Transcript_124819/g.249257 Transcript_124819/m.249257 type:complete len:110 (-) Transcript_124819:173-502(-)